MVDSFTTQFDRSTLTPGQRSALDALLTRDLNEDLASVAKRARVSLATLQKYTRDPVFARQLRLAVEADLGSQRAAVTATLIAGALDSDNKDHLGYVKEYFKRLDGESITVNIDDSRQSDPAASFPYHLLSVSTRKLIVAEIKQAIEQGKADKLLEGDILEAEFEVVQHGLEPAIVQPVIATIAPIPGPWLGRTWDQLTEDDLQEPQGNE